VRATNAGLKATADEIKVSKDKLNSLFELGNVANVSVWSGKNEANSGFLFLNPNGLKIKFEKEVTFTDGEAKVEEKDSFTASIAAANSILAAVKAENKETTLDATKAFEWKVGAEGVKEIASKVGKEIKLVSFKLKGTVEGDIVKNIEISEMKFNLNLNDFGVTDAINFTVTGEFTKDKFNTDFVKAFNTALGTALKDKEIDLEKISSDFKDVKVQLGKDAAELSLKDKNTWEILKTTLNAPGAGGSPGMAWWMWVLIFLAVVLVIGIIVFFVVKSKNDK